MKCHTHSSISCSDAALVLCVYKQAICPEPSMHEPKYDKDTHYIPLGSIMVFSRTANGAIVEGHPTPHDSKMVPDKIATTDTPESTNYKLFFWGFVVWVLTAGGLYGIGYGIYSLAVFATS